MERIPVSQVMNGERFFRVPKLLFESEIYKKMSADCELLYAILKDRFELSVKNNWIDTEDNIYFIFTVKEIGEMLGCGKDKVIKLKKELKKYDLLEEVRQGLNKPNLIYLGSLKVENIAKPLKIAEVGKTEFKKSENQNLMILNIVILKLFFLRRMKKEFFKILKEKIKKSFPEKLIKRLRTTKIIFGSWFMTNFSKKISHKQPLTMHDSF